MSAFMNNPNQLSQAELMEQYMKWSAFQKQQEEQHQSMAMFEQFMKQNQTQAQNQPHFTQSSGYQSQFNQTPNQNQYTQPVQQKEPDLPLFEQFMKQQFKTPQPQSFIPFDIDNFNGDGLQKSFDLAYQNESQKLSSL